MSSLCVRQCSKVYVSSFKFELTAEKRSQNLPSSIDRSRNEEKEFLQNFKSSPSPQKCLAFQSNLSTYKKETLATFLKNFGRLVCYFL